MTDNKTVEQESCKENTQGRSWIWRWGDEKVTGYFGP